ncbi:MAG: hypothetical protein NZ920_02340 [Aigarchaeota archaeon]|nr:hypothetical protein [Aigarchaeota archaeon]MDW8092535.1 ERCC4 domain-containing protein [Nitrososphaerota archaeon]
MIVIDSREAAESPKIVESLSKVVSVEVRPLDFGDYLILGDGRKAIIERKTIMDFLNSAKGRLWEQLTAIKGFDGESTLLLEGYLALYRKREWNEASVLAMMDSIIHKWGIPILYVPDVRATLAYLVWKDKDLGAVKEPRERALRMRRRDMSVPEQALYTLEGLCGHETAKALLAKFGSLGNAITFMNTAENAAATIGTLKVGNRRIPSKTVDRILKVVKFDFSRYWSSKDEPPQASLEERPVSEDEETG